MKTLSTWKNFAANSGQAVTSWNYDANRGFLTSKTYDGGASGPSYTYTSAGRLKTRVWARSITTAYSCDNGGSLATVVYSDGTTPNVTNTFDRLGRQATIACGGMTNTLSYNTANQLLSESFSGGTLAGLAVTNAYDSFLRRTAVALSNQTSTLVQYGYDNASRLQNVTNSTAKATYAYLANSPLVSQINFTNSGVQRMVTTKTYDFLNRLTAISSTPSAAAAISYTYTYNNANQRVRVALPDGSAWQYVYDSLGQVISGHKFFADGTPVAGQQFDYSFDNIGNRTQTLAGGDQSGLNQRSATYGANNLNQYTNRSTVPGFADILGTALATNTVTVGGQTPYRKGEYFRDQLPVSNSSAALWTNIVVASPNQTSITGNVFVAQSPENYSYDSDGNLTGDGRWTYTWDGENRLVSMQGQSGIPTGAKYKLDFLYDSQSRRIQKLVSTNNGSSYVAQITNRFIYDGWNMVALLNPASSVVQSFVWGIDLSGSPQGAGGVGGLLALNDTVNGLHFAAFDGNGNVAALTKAADGTVSAQYEYGPFGELLRMTGPMAKVNPFRSSTKYQDDETDLLYYGYRYEKDGRWLSRDPITEPGFYLLATGHQASDNSGITDDGDGDTPNLNDFLTASTPNVYAFVENDPVNKTDPLGLVIVGFYGANAWFSSPNEGNVKMKDIADAVGAGDHIYRSLDIWDPYQYLLNYFRDGPGRCSNEPIKIFGHSWGGISAVKLSRWIGRSALRNHETDVYVIDPVSKLRLPPTSVPSNVKYFWNRYQTAGQGVYIPGVGAVHGRKLTSYAQSSDQVDLNPSDPAGLDHFTIIDAVRDQLIQLLKN
jgi:RHS repeat-associated protein